MSRDVTCPDCDEKVTVKPGRSSAKCPACGSSVSADRSSARGGRRRDGDEDDREKKPKRKYREEWDDDDDDKSKAKPKTQGSLAWLWILLVVLGVVLAGCGGMVWWMVTLVKPSVSEPTPQQPQNPIERPPDGLYNAFGMNPGNRPAAPRPPDASVYPKRKPYDVDPAVLAPSNRVYLSDLKPFDVQQGAWPVGFNGSLGDLPGNWVVVDKKYYDHAISLRPPEAVGVARASFVTGQQARRLTGKVALNDCFYFGSHRGRLTFAVYKDGKEVWRSQPFKTKAPPESFDIDITGARVITIEAGSLDAHNGDSFCVWLDPVLEK